MLELIKGLRKLIPDVKYKGDLRDNSIDMYEAIVILNEGVEKPSYEEVYNAALSVYRKEKADEIDAKTADMIINNFTFSQDEDKKKFHLSLQWQFNIQTLFLNKDFLTYPYLLKINSDENNKPVYFSIEDIDMFTALYGELFHYISECTISGFREKEKIAEMSESELNNYVDER